MSTDSSVIKAIVLDLGDVLLKLNWDKPLATLFGDQQQKTCGLLQKILTAHDGAYDLFERGMIEEDAFFVQFKKDLKLSQSIDEIKKSWEYLIEGPVEGIEDLLARIPERYSLSILSNISKNVYHYVNPEGAVPLYSVISRFESFYASFKFKCRKPEVEIYTRTFEYLKKNSPDLIASEILFIDDRQDNVDGAIRAGWTAEKSEPAQAGSVEQILKKHQIL